MYVSDIDILLFGQELKRLEYCKDRLYKIIDLVDKFLFPIIDFNNFLKPKLKRLNNYLLAIKGGPWVMVVLLLLVISLIIFISLF